MVSYVEKLEYAMSASTSMPSPHRIGILDVRRGPFSGVQRLLTTLRLSSRGAL